MTFSGVSYRHFGPRSAAGVISCPPRSEVMMAQQMNPMMGMGMPGMGGPGAGMGGMPGGM